MISFLKKFKKNKKEDDKFSEYKKYHKSFRSVRGWFVILLFTLVLFISVVFASLYTYSIYFKISSSPESSQNIIRTINKEKVVDIIDEFNKKKAISEKIIQDNVRIIDPSL